MAQCLATILNQLERLAAEAAAALPVAFHRHAARARAIAGCHALPPRGPDLANGNPSRTWERAG